MPRPRRISEFAAISQLQTIFRGRSQRVEVGIGDDAAVLKPQGRLVWTVDTAVEHVHFERAWLSLADLGWRSFQAAASDVSAMAGTPIAALSSVIFPARFGAAELAELARGQRAAARAWSCGSFSRSGTRASPSTGWPTVRNRRCPGLQERWRSSRSR